MGVLRGLSLASIVALPAFILGFIAYVAIANARGATIDATEWETWMFLPCYGAVSYTHLTLPTNREV